MATPRNIVTRAAAPGPATANVIDEWLADLSARLVGPRRARDAAIAEIRDGLLETVDAYRGGGAPPDQAAAAAIAEFGHPATIARAFAPELAARQARRTALALIGTGPLVGVLWAFAIASSHLLTQPAHTAPPWQWPGLPTGLRIASALLCIALAIGIPAGFLTIATTGRLGRRLPDRPKFAPTAAATVGAAGISADLIVLTALAGTAAIAPARLAWAPIAVASLASLTRLALNARATRRLLTTRVALN